MPVIFTRGGDTYEVYQGNDTFRVVYEGEDILKHSTKDTVPDEPIPEPDDPVVPDEPTPDPVPDDPVVVPTPPVTNLPIDIVVSNQAELASALATASGVTIGCNPGTYGKLNFTRKPAKPVIVTSVDLNNKAKFTGMNINNATNFIVDGVQSNYTWASGHNDWDKHCQMLNSTNCSIQGCDIIGGNTPAGYGFSEAIFNRNGFGNSIIGNKITGFTRQIHNYKSVQTDIVGNDLSLMRGDGITLTDSIGGTRVEYNTIHDWKASATDGYHRDGIEFWVESGQPDMDGLVVSNNTIHIGNGPWAQGIFGRNTSGAIFTNNKVYNFHTHGITVNKSSGITVTDNLVVRTRSSHATCDQSIANGTSYPKINVPSASGNISNNVVQ